MADDAGLINEVLAETSFLYGGNAAFVEDPEPVGRILGYHAEPGRCRIAHVVTLDPECQADFEFAHRYLRLE